jgi:hypothetical protein
LTFFIILTKLAQWKKAQGFDVCARIQLYCCRTGRALRQQWRNFPSFAEILAVHLKISFPLSEIHNEEDACS